MSVDMESLRLMKIIEQEHRLRPQETFEAMLLVMGTTSQVVRELVDREPHLSDQQGAVAQVRALSLPRAQAALPGTNRTVELLLELFEVCVANHVSWRNGPGAPGAVVDDQYS